MWISMLTLAVVGQIDGPRLYTNRNVLRTLCLVKVDLIPLVLLSEAIENDRNTNIYHKLDKITANRYSRWRERALCRPC